MSGREMIHMLGTRSSRSENAGTTAGANVALDLVLPDRMELFLAEPMGSADGVQRAIG